MLLLSNLIQLFIIDLVQGDIYYNITACFFFQFLFNVFTGFFVSYIYEIQCIINV